MKKLIILLSLFIIGCSPKNSYIIPTGITNSISKKNIQIGIKKVQVPEYLLSDKILIKKGNKLKELDASFATSIDSLLTSNAIKELKVLLNDPNVVLYPWEAKSKRGYIVEIIVDDYIYYNGSVHLSGSYYIKDAKGNLISSKNFNLTNPSKEDADAIVETLGILFDRLIKEIAQTIAT